MKGEHGSDICAGLAPANGQQSCSYSISKKMPAEASAIALRILPAGAPSKAEIHDSTGHSVAQDSLWVTPSRMIVASALTTERHVDLLTGEARLALTHPRAVTSVDCDTGRFACSCASRAPGSSGARFSTRVAVCCGPGAGTRGRSVRRAIRNRSARDRELHRPEVSLHARSLLCRRATRGSGRKCARACDIRCPDDSESRARACVRAPRRRTRSGTSQGRSVQANGNA